MGENFICTFSPKIAYYTTEQEWQFDYKIWAKNVWEKIKDEFDTRRCQGITRQGQCSNIRMEGSEFCPAHGGNKGAESREKKNMNNFRLTQFKTRASELSESNNLSSLKDEVALTRILIEEMWNRCSSSQELLLSSGPLSDLIGKSAALVEKCHKLDSRLGNLLSRSQVMQFAQVIVEIISRNITDEKILESMSDDINAALEGLE